jgi:hypothetical protein
MAVRRFGGVLHRRERGRLTLYTGEESLKNETTQCRFNRSVQRRRDKKTGEGRKRKGSRREKAFPSHYIFLAIHSRKPQREGVCTCIYGAKGAYLNDLAGDKVVHALRLVADLAGKGLLVDLFQLNHLLELIIVEVVCTPL